MIRSRDLVVFVVVLFFVCAGMLLTYLKDVRMPLLMGAPVVFDVTSLASTTFVAISQEKTINRGANIERLRAALASNDIVTLDPSVESEDTVPEDATATSTSVSQSVLSCATGEDSGSVMANWPRADVLIAVKDGVRSVVHVKKTEVLPDTTASSSTSTVVSALPLVEVVSLIQMQMYPRVLASSSCVPSDIIGVTTKGGLLSNTDARFYKTTPHEELIGYARDGFPVYGAYSGEVDGCGGYVHPEGYRYTISSERNFVLGCYVGAPSAFEL